MTERASADPDPSEPPAKLVFVTGPSGAGRTTAIAALEDLGFETIDNIPLGLLPRLIDGPASERPVAIGIGVANRDFSTAGLAQMIDALRGAGDAALQVVYLDCAADILVRRYSETRRRHPLAPAETPADGIAREIDLLGAIRARADILIDTTENTPHDTRAEIARWFAPEGPGRLAVTVHSFSYKRGLPRGIDTIFDVRFLKNPYWEPSLRARDGRDGAVAAHIAGDPRFPLFFSRVRDLVLDLLPAYREEGKSHVAFGFGCTGGQHRSVMLTERLASSLAEAGWRVSIRHRELDRRRSAGRAREG